MNMNKKVVCLFLCALAVGSAMASCGEAGGAETKETEAALQNDAAVTEAETEAPTQLELLPEADYGGYEFKCLLNDQDNRYIDIMTEGAETGDTFNDLIYARNRAVEEKYNIKISGESNEYGQVNAMLQKCVTSGDTAYDLYFSNCYATGLASGGYLYVLNDLPNLDLTKPWWDTAALKGMSVAGKVYMVTGDISPTSLLTSSCLVFNKKLFASNDMEFPYQLAAEGKWTLDKLVSMTKDLTRDLNGDGKYTLGDDLFSFSSWMCDSPYSLFYGAGATLSKKGSDDIPYIEWDVDKISAVYMKMYELIIEGNSYFVTNAGEYETTYQNFANGNAYICEITLQKIDMFLRNMEDDYGILPIPKWDEAQPDYLSCVNGAGGFIVVPNNPSDAERTGMIFEALAAGAYDAVTPSLYEVITKTKNVRDAESGDMVELIIRNRVYDPFYINLINGYGFAQTMLQNKKTDVASQLAKLEKGATNAFNKMIAAYTEND